MASTLNDMGTEDGDTMSLCGDIIAEAGLRTRPASLLHMRVLATTDLHAHLLPYDYCRDRPDDSVGLVRLAGLITAARSECTNTLLLDNGDTLQGAPLGDMAVAEWLHTGEAHPMIAALNALGYDAATLGNHDFDFGLEVLKSAIADAAFPVVLSNIRYKDGTPLVAPRVILDREMTDELGRTHRLRIGITGAAPPQIMRWGRSMLGDHLQAGDILDAVKTEAQALKADGADIVLALLHSGLGGDVIDPGAENAARAVAALPEINGVIAGHSHGVFPQKGGRGDLVKGTPLVQPGHWGSHLGCIDLLITAEMTDTDASKPTTWKVAYARAAALPGGGDRAQSRVGLQEVLRNRPDLRDTVKSAHRATKHYADRPLGMTAVPLETYFSFLAPCPATQIVADAQRAAAAAMLADRNDLSNLPLISAAAPFKCGGRGGPGNYTDIAAGPLRLRNAADLYVYANQMVILKTNGQTVREWLERVASAFHQIVPKGPNADPQPLLRHDFAGYNFDLLDGLTYRFDLSKPARTNAEGDEVYETPGRVTDLCLPDGTMLDDQDDLLVVTNSYRAGGGGHFFMCAEADSVVTTPETVRDLVMAEIAGSPGPLAPVVRPTFGFVPLNETPVLFETGPGSAHHPSRIEDFGLVAAGRNEAGFARYLWTL